MTRTARSPLYRLGPYLRLMRLDRPVGIWLLLWPVLWALWAAAGGVPPLDVLLIFVLGTIVMRSAGCVINDYADRDFDPLVRRTAQRPLAAGEVPPQHALWLFGALCLLALLLVLQTNRLTVLLAVPAVLLAASYPFAKRFHHLPQAHLGMAFAWGIPMAQAAVGNLDPAVCAVLMAATVSWAMAYDTFYAMADRDDDLRAGVRSTAILFGRHDRLITGLLQVATLLLLASLGWLLPLGGIYAAGILVAAALAIRHQWLVRGREPQACLRAFLENHHIGLVIFVAMVLDYALAAA